MENSNVTSVVEVSAVSQASAVNPLLFGVIQKGGVNDNFVQIEFFAVPSTLSGDPTKEFLYVLAYRKELTSKQAERDTFYFQTYNKDTGEFGDVFNKPTNFANEILRPFSHTLGSKKLTGYVASKYVRVVNTAYKPTSLITTK
jgi:hypothetical protein